MQETPELGSIKSKDAPTYVTATGRMTGNSDDLVTVLSDDLRRAGFTPVPPAQPRPGVVSGIRDDLVTEIAVYEQLGSLPEEAGAAYVQLQLGRRDRALAWTQVSDS